MDSILQSVIFNKHIWTARDAVLWLIRHNLTVIKLDETEIFYRMRQVSPTALKKKGYTLYYTKKIGDGSIEFVMAHKPRLAHATTHRYQSQAHHQS